MKKGLQQELKRFSDKEVDYEKKIENLEREIVGSNGLKTGNKKLENTIKTLEFENAALLT